MCGGNNKGKRLKILQRHPILLMTVYPDRRAEVGLKRVVSSGNGDRGPDKRGPGELGCAPFNAFSCNSDVLVDSERMNLVTNSALI